MIEDEIFLLSDLILPVLLVVDVLNDEVGWQPF